MRWCKTYEEQGSVRGTARSGAGLVLILRTSSSLLTEIDGAIVELGYGG